MGISTTSTTGVGCPRCGCRVVVRETQFIGRKSKVMETCDRCGHVWWDSTTPRSWKTIAVRKPGQFLCIVS